jgi:hypothetical protein
MRSGITIARVVALTAVIGVGGCGGDGAGGGETLARWSLDEVVRIGSIDDPDQGLTRVARIVFGPDSLLYISQSTEAEIRAYALDGSLVRRIGRDGEGPGEFRAVGAFGFIGDTLFVTDNTLSRFSLFDGDGAFLESSQWTTVAGEPRDQLIEFPVGPEVVLADGSALAQQGVGYRRGAAARFDVPVLRLHRGSTRQDTVALRSFELPAVTMLSEQGHEHPILAPIQDYSLIEIMEDGSGVAIVERAAATSAEAHAFRLVKIDADGDTTLAREYPYTPVATPAAEAERHVDALLERTASSPRGSPSREGVLRTYSQNGFIPAFLPPVNALRTAQDGSIWIERERAAPDSTTWNVIGESGELAGEVRLGGGARVMAATDDLLAVLELDALDVPYVTIYRIAR